MESAERNSENNEVKNVSTENDVEVITQSDKSNPLLNKKLLIVIVSFSLLVIIGLLSFALIAKNNQTEELVNQNKRLKSFPPASDTNPESTELIDARKKVLEYAKKNNITVTDDEISSKKEQLKASNGVQSVQDILNTYGWSENDWTEVVRWQLLREKILQFTQPNRQGETLSIRWDMFAPKLTQEYADKLSPLAKQYLMKVKQDLENKTLTKLFDVYSTFDIRKEPIFEGKESQYGMQYSGWDQNSTTFKDYLVLPDSTVYNDIYSQKIPSVSEPFCNIGGCQIYNVVSGSNGDQEASEIIDILTKQELYF